ncbi:hypothetical protein H4S08_000122 [Coemansia sp. RSA 1365]|nr:hypothetical protein H4S08_000122 [Coemansia sp. RSA 1365]
MQTEDRPFPEEMSYAINEFSGGNKRIFTRLVRGILTPYKFYVSFFSGNEDIRSAVKSGGGILVILKDIEEADFIINTQRSSFNRPYAIPICHPHFITDSVQSGKVVDYSNYLIDNPKSKHQHKSKPATKSSPTCAEDDIIADVHRLYSDSNMDADDCYMDSYLSSISRNISEYKTHALESPGAQSTNSVDISDSDYRIKQGLDRDAIDVRDIPAPNSPLAREIITTPISKPYFNPLASATTDIRMRERSRYTQANSGATNRTLSSVVAQQQKRRNPHFDRKDESGSSAGSPFLSGGSGNVLPSGLKRGALDREPVSPELEVPSPQTPMTSEFVFVKRAEGTATSQRSVKSNHTRNSNAEPHPEHDSDVADLSEDEQYPDPLSFLAARSPNPRTTSPLQNGSSSQETGATSPEITSGTPVRGASITDIDRVSNSTGRVIGSARQAQRRMSSWRGLRKRRRTSSNETGYGEQPVPVVIDRRASSVLSPPGLTKQQLSQPLLEDRPIAALRSRSVDEVMESGKEQTGNRTQLWSASKRIRMSGTESSNDGSESNRNADLQHTKTGAITPYTASVLESAGKSTMLPSELSSPLKKRNSTVSEALQRDIHNPDAVILADESSSYPTTNSSAPPVLSVDDPGRVVHVSQTPDVSSQETAEIAKEHGIGALSPLTSSSSQLTEPILDQTTEADAATVVVGVQPTADVLDEKDSAPDGGEVSQKQASEDVQIERGESLQAFNESYTDQSPMAMDNGDKDADNDDIEFNIAKPSTTPETNLAPESTPAQHDSREDSERANGGTASLVEADPCDSLDYASANLAGNQVASGEQTTPQQYMSTRQRPQRTVAATENIRRTSARTDILKRRSLGPDTLAHSQSGRQRKASFSRRMTMCQRLQQLNELSTSDGRLGIQMDPALAPPARLLVSNNHGDTLNIDSISTPSTPSRRATFSGAMRVLGECDPVVTDTDRLRYMCKLKGLIDGTELSAREALQTLYFFTGDWVSARRYIVLGKGSLTEDCMWSVKEDEVLLQGLDSEKMEELRERKGNVEVYRRLQFLNTFHSTRAH